MQETNAAENRQRIYQNKYVSVMPSHIKCQMRKNQQQNSNLSNSRYTAVKNWNGGLASSSSLRASLLSKNQNGMDDGGLAMKILQDGSVIESEDNNLSCMSLTDIKFSKINLAKRLNISQQQRKRINIIRSIENTQDSSNNVLAQQASMNDSEMIYDETSLPGAHATA